MRKKLWRCSQGKMETKYKVAAINVTDIFLISETADGKLEGINGIELNLLRILAEELRFMYEIVTPEDGHWGKRRIDGNWTGILGMLKRKEADLAVELISVTSDRVEAAEFSHPYTMDEVSFITGAPSYLSKTKAFVYPFDELVWIGLMITLLCSSWILFMCRKHEFSRKRNSKSVCWNRQLLQLSGLLLNQGCKNNFQSSSTRIFLSFWLVSRSIVVFGYTGVLLSYLMVPQREISIRTVEKLTEAVVKGKIDCGTLKGSAFHARIMRSSDGVMKTLGDHFRMHRENLFTCSREALRKVKRGRFAVIDLNLFHQLHINALGRHFYYLSPESIWNDPIAVAFKKDFCCISAFNKVIQRVTEAGLHGKWIADQLFQIQLKAPEEKRLQGIRPLRMKEVVGAFFILLPGYALASVALFGEIILNKRRLNKILHSTLLSVK